MLSRRFWGYIRRHRRAYVWGYAAVLASILMTQLSPWALKLAIDGIRGGASSRRLLVYAGALVVIAALEAAFSYAMRIQILGAALEIEAELRRDYFVHLQRMHLGFFQGARTGDLMARAVNDIRAVQRFAGVGLMRSCHTVVMLIVSVAFMLSIDVRLTLWTMVILPLVSVLFVALGREIHRRFDRVQAQFSALSARAQENFSGIRVGKAVWQEGRASMERLDEIFDRAPQITDAPHPVVLEAPRGRVEFRNVTFAYGPAPVLRQITLTIPAGSTVAIVGPTGAGKSTLVHLIPRLFDASSGQVLVDGHDVREISLGSLRRAIGIVPQETFLFSDTMAENIALGFDGADGGAIPGAAAPAGDAAIAGAAAIAGIARDVEEFPHRYATVVGERGVTLSGGQK